MNTVNNTPTHTEADAAMARHQALFEKAQAACRERFCWSPFPETPGQYPDSENADAAGRAAFEAHCGQLFRMDAGAAQAQNVIESEEVSPYTQKSLGTRYVQPELDGLFASARSAVDSWSQASAQQRIGVLLEVVDTLYREHLFEIAHAVMHTAGQSYNMAYAGSGVNALDRAIEALVYADQAMSAVATSATWERKFGKATISLQKTYRLVPRGVAVCFTCATFATWNAWPSIMASLATGNAVIVKPHPTAVLPMAISVRVFRNVLQRFGFDPNLVTMALDTTTEPIGKVLVQHPETDIVDFTGSVKFGQWVEANAHPAICFTETAGCNTVVLESADDLDAAIRSLATTLCMFSAQMCTSPQNIYIPAQGVRTPAGLVSFDEVGKRLAAAVNAVGAEPKKASMILAAIQSPATLAQMKQLRDDVADKGAVLLEPHPYAHPDYPDARTSTPMMLQVKAGTGDWYRAERFGPISFVIECGDAADALSNATRDVAQFGGLTAFLYSTDEAFIARAEAAYAKAGAQLTINLTGPMPLNFAAAYSDYHVTGLNPAGNASLTDLSFVASRFRITQSRRPTTGNA